MIRSLGASFERILSACSGLSKRLTDESAEELRLAAAEIHGLRRGLEDTERLRPYVDALSIAQHLATGIESVLTAYLDALTADLPLGAQRHARKAQDAIDSLAGALAHSSERAAVVDTLQRGNYLDEGGLNLLDAVSQLAPGTSLLALDEQGRHALSSITGRTPTIPGVGISYLVFDLIAEHHFNSEAYRNKLEMAGRLLRTNRTSLSDLLADSDFQSDLSDAQARALRMNVTLDRLMRGGLPEGMLVDQLIDTYRESLEFLGLPCIAFVLRLTGRKTARYGALRSQDVSALAELCADDATAGMLIGGYSKTIRHAASHAGGYVKVDGAISITLRKRQEIIPIPDLINQMFEYLESCQALMLLIESELPPSRSQRNTTSVFMDGMSPAQRVTFALRSCGASEVQGVEQVGDRLTALISWQGGGLLLLCRVIAEWVGPEVRIVRVASDGGERYVEVPVSDLQASLQSGIDTPLDILRLIENAKGPDGLVLQGSMLRHLAYVTVAKADWSVPGVREVKAYWQAAKRVGDTDLAEALQAALVRLRLGDEALRGTDEGRHFLFLAGLAPTGPLNLP
ncbi:hypothetical protein [Modestobacter roseus]|uniref:hypothetical protein n=1 Tax=Modestobacter roseus TaxID=1181884 RepID=UPI00129689AA|nr:hypothetical protein [Modestobacter roseus]MQA35805.1 hypothetical protein [Modestobacter roseus]